MPIRYDEAIFFGIQIIIINWQ